jgi:hypothetical protein
MPSATSLALADTIETLTEIVEACRGSYELFA